MNAYGNTPQALGSRRNLSPTSTDLTPAIDGRWPSRLLDVVPGRSGVVVEQRLAQRTEQLWSTVTTVANVNALQHIQICHILGYLA